MRFNETNLQIFGAAMILYAVLTIGLSFFFNSLTAKATLPAPIMRLEFVRGKEEVDGIVGGESGAREGLKTFLLWDSFAFVPIYFIFLLVMSFMFFGNQANWAQVAGKMVIVLAIIAAASDLTENYYSYLALENKTEHFTRIYWAAHAKWLTIFLATGILSFIFCRWDGWAVAWAILLLSSLVGLYLTIASLLRIVNISEQHAIITGALLLQLIVLPIVGAFFLFFEKFRLDFLKSY
jgi:hypothetical protein